MATKHIHNEWAIIGANVSITSHLIRGLLKARILTPNQAKAIFNGALKDHRRAPGDPPLGRETRKLIREERRRVLGQG